MGLGYNETVTFFFGRGGGGDIAKLDFLAEIFLNILGLFLKVKIQNWNIFWGLLTFNNYWGFV